MVVSSIMINTSKVGYGQGKDKRGKPAGTSAAGSLADDPGSGLRANPLPKHSFLPFDRRQADGKRLVPA